MLCCIAGDKNLGQAAPEEQTLIRPGSKQLPLQPNPLWEPLGQLGKLQAAKIPAKAATSAHSQDQYNMSAGRIKSHPGSGQTSSTIAARSAGHCQPYSSEREQDLISLSPPSREATSAGNTAFMGGPARDAWHGQEPSLGLKGPALGRDEARLGLGGTQGDRIRDTRRKAATAEQNQKKMEALHRPAWNAGPAARPPPRGRKPTQILRQSTQSLPASSQVTHFTASSFTAISPCMRVRPCAIGRICRHTKFLHIAHGWDPLGGLQHMLEAHVLIHLLEFTSCVFFRSCLRLIGVLVLKAISRLASTPDPFYVQNEGNLQHKRI